MSDGANADVKVFIHNDDLTHMEFVVFVLQSIFDKAQVEATAIMLQVHHEGVSVAGSYPLETAKAKLSAVRLLADAKGFPLQCTLEGEPGPFGTCTVKGWGMTGSHRRDYSAELSSELFEGKPVVRTWRSGEGKDGFGSLCQQFKAEPYRGKRVRFSAALRTVDVKGLAALCLRVDGPGSASEAPLAFDNMSGRPPISGTSPWTRHACVLDVPVEASAIFISNIVVGRGELLWADVRFEVVDDSVPVTTLPTTHSIPDAPANLDFSE